MNYWIVCRHLEHFVCVILVLRYFGVCHEENYFNEQACYGTTDNTFVEPSCPDGQIIFIRDLRAYAKRIATGCPKEVLNTAVPSTCCQYHPDDCGDRYQGYSLPTYRACSGQSTCKVKVAWMNTPVETAGCSQNSSAYHEQTTYMVMSYNCVPENITESLDQNFTITGTDVYVTNRDYPNPTPNQTFISSTCSVEASCSTSVILSAIDVNFTTTNGRCNGGILVSDGSDSTTITCNTTNDFRTVQLYASTNHFIILDIVGNSSDVDFLFWLKLSGADPSAEVTLSCGSEARTSPNTVAPSICPVLDNCDGVFCDFPDNTTVCNDGNENELSASCGQDHVISIREVSSATKPVSDGCTFGSTGGQSCCSYNPSDCRIRHNDPTVYVQSCTGRSDCSPFSSSISVDTACDSAMFPNTTNYMVLEYYCVNRTSIVPACSGSSTSGSTLYIWNKYYPDDVKFWAEKNCTFSIQSDKDTAIRVTILDLELAGEAGTSVSECKQEVVMTESDTIEHNIGCEYNNAYTVQEVLLTDTGNLDIEFLNSLNTDGGRYWIEFSAVDPSIILTIYSDVGPETTTTDTFITTTTTTTDTTTITTDADNTDTTTITTTTDNYDNTTTTATTMYTNRTTPKSTTTTPIHIIKQDPVSATPETGQSTEEGSNNVAILVAAILAPLIILLIVIVVCCCIHKEKICRKDKDADITKTNSTESVSPLLAPVPTSTAALSTSFPGKHNGTVGNSYRANDIMPLQRQSSLVLQRETGDVEGTEEKRVLKKRQTFHGQSLSQSMAVGAAASAFVATEGHKDTLQQSQDIGEGKQVEEKQKRKKKKKKRKLRRTVEAVSAFGYPSSAGLEYPTFSQSYPSKEVPVIHPAMYRQGSFPGPGTASPLNTSHYQPGIGLPVPARLPSLSQSVGSANPAGEASKTKRAWRKAMAATMFAQPWKIHPTLDIIDVDKPDLRETVYLGEDDANQSYI